MSTPQTPKTPTPRTRGRKPLLAPPMGIESIEAAEALASNPKALELSSQIAAHKRTIEQLTSERTKLNEELAEVKRTAQSQRDTLKGRNQEIQALKTSDLAFRAAMWGAIETLTAGTCALQPDDPKWINTPPADLAGLLVEAVEYGRIGIEMTAVVEELLEIEGDPKEWRAQVERAIATKIEAAEGPLRAERDHYKAEAKRYRDSTNSLGGMLKAQGRDEEYHGPEADLPGGLLSGINWGRVVVWAACAGIGFLLLQLAMLAGKGGRP